MQAPAGRRPGRQRFETKGIVLNLIRGRFLVRIMLTCFVGIHTPLIGILVLWLMTDEHVDWIALGAVLAATLVATAGTLLLLRREMAPVLRISHALESFADRREIVPIEHVAPDEIGALARSAAWAIETADHLLRETERQARTDGLTGLANRRAFLERAERSPGGSVAIVDVDKFKAINDTHGHQAGDDVLRAVAGILRDAVGESGCAARLGGEEFGILLPAATPEEAVRLIEQARSALAAAPVLRDRIVSFSAGVAGRTDDIAADLARADGAMYRAKRAGRNRIERSAEPRDRRRIHAPALDDDAETGLEHAGPVGIGQD